jgi:glycosyltransferase involved in cell wall biosynthesis
MRVAIDVRSLMEGRLSGVEVYTIQLLRELTREASDIDWQLFYNAWQPVPMPHFSNVQWRAFRWPNKLLNATQYWLGQPTWDSLVPADVFFMPNFRLLPLAPTKPLVVTVHDISFERFPEFYSLKRRLWHRFMRPQELLKRADHIIADSTATRDDLAELYGIELPRMSVIYPGISLDVSGDVRAWRPLPQKFILYLGTLEPRKNVVSLVEAFSAIADTIPQDLVIAGSPGWLTKPVERAIAESPQRHRIHRLGFVPDELKGSLYAAADLFVYPSFYEGFGFPPLEALLAGTPVVTSYNSSLPEVVGEWATLIDPYKPAELATVLQELLRNPPAVPPAIQEQIRARYSWRKAAAATLGVLKMMR